MSRIRGIEVKVQKEVLQTRKYGLNEILKKKSEDQSSDSKDDIEKKQISELLSKLPKLESVFEVHRKIGEGTFSSVYLGSLRAHAAMPPAQRRWFAIKHLVPTAHPARVEQELRCLQDMGGKHHVIGVDLCLRHLDTIVFIMPYIPHKKFSEYVGSMCAGEVRGYMRALLTALRHVHSFGVIHRDVKPSNFLYDRENRRYLLVDFGLAQRLVPPPEPPAPPPAHAAHIRKRPRVDDEGTPDAKRAALDLRVASRTRALEPKPEPKPTTTPDGGVAGRAACACAGVGGVCSVCSGRPAARAPRAGTQGYRPPEVLLKVPGQSTAVDVWAAGVVLAASLTARYPFLRAQDDVTAVAELVDLLGERALRCAAHSLQRRLVLGMSPVSPRPALCLRRLAGCLRGAPLPAAKQACARCSIACMCRAEGEDPAAIDPTRTVAGFPDSAFALAARLLEPDPALRLTAAEALEHPFLKEE